MIVSCVSRNSALCCECKLISNLKSCGTVNRGSSKIALLVLTDGKKVRNEIQVKRV